MKKTRSNIITTSDQLIPALGNSFIVLFGSAVSGKLSPRTPMVTEVKTFVLELAARRMEEGSKADKLAAEYTRKLLSTEPYRSILETTKFETFIGKLSKCVGQNAVNNLIAQLFNCQGNEYGPNHSALAFLLKKRVCLAALTTNFDNALELAYPKLKTCDYKTAPTQLPTSKEPPVLIKLHGDAACRTSIATSRGLFGATLQKHFSFLKDLLNGQNILVLGYSGYGDIDITPHLMNTKAQFFWCNHHFAGVKPPIRENLTRVLCDVSFFKGEPSMGTVNIVGKYLQDFGIRDVKIGQVQSDNLLIKLAQHYGWTTQHYGNDMNWKENVRAWVMKRRPVELTKFVVSLLSWHTEWPHMHIAYYRIAEKKQANLSIDYGDALTQVKAYHNAIEYLDKIIRKNPKESLPSIEAIKLLGYNFWRMGRFQDALLTLYPIIRPKFWFKLDVRARSHISDAARNYLETLIELFYRASNNSDFRYAQKYVLPDKFVNKILTLENQSIGNEYLLRCVIYEIRHAIGQRVSSDEIRKLYNEAFSMEEWPAAAVISRFWLLFNWLEAIRPWLETTRILWKRGKRDLVVQNFASLAYSIFRIGIVYRVLYNHHLIRIRTLRTEYILKKRQKEWSADLGFGSNRLDKQ